MQRLYLNILGDFFDVLQFIRRHRSSWTKERNGKTINNHTFGSYQYIDNTSIQQRGDFRFLYQAVSFLSILDLTQAGLRTEKCHSRNKGNRPGISLRYLDATVRFCALGTGCSALKATPMDNVWQKSPKWVLTAPAYLWLTCSRLAHLLSRFSPLADFRTY